MDCDDSVEISVMLHRKLKISNLFSHGLYLIVHLFESRCEIVEYNLENDTLKKCRNEKITDCY